MIKTLQLVMLVFRGVMKQIPKPLANRVPSLKVTFLAPEKWMVGRRSFPFGMAYFQRRFVSFREGIALTNGYIFGILFTLTGDRGSQYPFQVNLNAKSTLWSKARFLFASAGDCNVRSAWKSRTLRTQCFKKLFRIFSASIPYWTPKNPWETGRFVQP